MQWFSQLHASRFIINELCFQSNAEFYRVAPCCSPEKEYSAMLQRAGTKPWLVNAFGLQ
jgi:hypothetical protein